MFDEFTLSCSTCWQTALRNTNPVPRIQFKRLCTSLNMFLKMFSQSVSFEEITALGISSLKPKSTLWISWHGTQCRVFPVYNPKAWKTWMITLQKCQNLWLGRSLLWRSGKLKCNLSLSWSSGTTAFVCLSLGKMYQQRIGWVHNNFISCNVAQACESSIVEHFMTLICVIKCSVGY